MVMLISLAVLINFTCMYVEHILKSFLLGCITGVFGKLLSVIVYCKVFRQGHFSNFILG
jgi:hypothetical protein